MLDVVQVVRTADLHSVQDIVEIYPHLRLDSFAEEEPLGKSESLVALKRVSQAGIVWSRVAYSPSPRILKLVDVEDRNRTIRCSFILFPRARWACSGNAAAPDGLICLKPWRRNESATSNLS